MLQKKTKTNNGPSASALQMTNCSGRSKPQDLLTIDNLAERSSYAIDAEISVLKQAYYTERYKIYRFADANVFSQIVSETIQHGSSRVFGSTNDDSNKSYFWRRIFHSKGIDCPEHSLKLIYDEKVDERNWDECSEFSGFSHFSPEKTEQVILYFAKTCSPFVAKMNKMLFFSDFLCFKRYVSPITGIRYVALANGPTPDNFSELYNLVKSVRLVESINERGIPGERFVARKGFKFNKSLFNQHELKILSIVASLFKKMDTDDLILLSRNETGWINNINKSELISYIHAFELKAF